MNAKVEAKEFQFDGLKWLLVAVFIFGGAFANSYFSEVAFIYRLLALVAVGIVAALIAVNTEKGNSFWDLMKAAQIEVRKVVWPSRQETIQTTLIVVAVVIVTAIILWLLDMGLGYLASLIIG